MSSVHSVVSQVIKPEQIRPTDSKHAVLVQEMNNNTASATFVHPVPTVDHQVEREKSESWDAFPQAPRAD